MQHNTLNLRITEHLAAAGHFTEEDAFAAIREAGKEYPDCAFRLVGPFGLDPARVYRLHAYAAGHGAFRGFVTAESAR